MKLRIQVCKSSSLKIFSWLLSRCFSLFSSHRPSSVFVHVLSLVPWSTTVSLCCYILFSSANRFGSHQILTWMQTLASNEEIMPEHKQQLDVSDVGCRVGPRSDCCFLTTDNQDCHSVQTDQKSQSQSSQKPHHLSENWDLTEIELNNLVRYYSVEHLRITHD